MKHIKIPALILAFIIAFSFSACKKNGDDTNTVTSAEDTDVTVITSAETPSVSSVPSDKTETTVTDTSVADDPSLWSTAQIIDFYRNAAKKSNGTAVSSQGIKLTDISVNNGQFEGVFDFIMPIMSKLLANNSTEKVGITGGFDKLTEADVASAKAYKVGDDVAVELIMKKQISGPYEDALGGSVGHAITAVGDIGAVTKQLTDLGLPLVLSEKDTKIIYTNPTVKVTVNEKGEIVSGTWKYTVEIKMDNYRVFGKTVETTSVIMDNVITVGGGFTK